MKKATLCILAASVVLEVRAQGTIEFTNFDLPLQGGGTYNALISVRVVRVDQNQVVIDGYDRYGGPELTVGLFLEGDPNPLATTPFLTEFGSEYYWMFREAQQVVVPGVLPGATAQFVVRAWRTSAGSYLASPELMGQSATFTSRPLGGPNPTIGELPFTTPVTRFEGFRVGGPHPGGYLIEVVPEPTFAGAGMAGGLWLMIRRKSSIQTVL